MVLRECERMRQLFRSINRLQYARHKQELPFLSKGLVR